MNKYFQPGNVTSKYADGNVLANSSVWSLAHGKTVSGYGVST